MEKDDRIADEAEPDVAAHPRGCAPHAPDREPFPQAQQAGEDHEAEADYSVEDADDRSAACATDGEMGVWNVDREPDRESDHAAPKPSPMCSIDEHRLYFLRSIIPGAML